MIFIKFCLAGMLSIATDYGAYLLLSYFIPTTYSKGISFLLGGFVAYILNKYWTFEQKRKSAKEAFLFFFVNFVALGLNIFLNQITLRLTNGNVTFSFAVATSACAVFLYFGLKYLVFRKII